MDPPYLPTERRHNDPKWRQAALAAQQVDDEIPIQLSGRSDQNVVSPWLKETNKPSTK